MARVALKNGELIGTFSSRFSKAKCRMAIKSGHRRNAHAESCVLNCAGNKLALSVKIFALYISA